MPVAGKCRGCQHCADSQWDGRVLLGRERGGAGGVWPDMETLSSAPENCKCRDTKTHWKPFALTLGAGDECPFLPRCLWHLPNVSRMQQ